MDNNLLSSTECVNHISKTRAFINIEAGLRNAMENGEIDRETAKSLYEYLECEFETGHANPFGTFDVTVSFYSQDILTITVEADSEDEAIESVQQDISLDEMSLSFSISHNYESGEFNGDVDSWSWRDMIIDNLEYSATPSAE